MGLCTFERTPRNSSADLANRFTFHSNSSPQQIEFYNQWRAKCLELAEWLCDHTPESREQSLALTNFEQAMFFGTAGASRNHDRFCSNES